MTWHAKVFTKLAATIRHVRRAHCHSTAKTWSCSDDVISLEEINCTFVQIVQRPFELLSRWIVCFDNQNLTTWDSRVFFRESPMHVLRSNQRHLDFTLRTVSFRVLLVGIQP